MLNDPGLLCLLARVPVDLGATEVLLFVHVEKQVVMPVPVAVTDGLQVSVLGSVSSAHLLRCLLSPLPGAPWLVFLGPWHGIRLPPHVW